MQGSLSAHVNASANDSTFRRASVESEKMRGGAWLDR